VEKAVAFNPPVSKPVGWIFEKRKKYDDSDETYLHETWVEIQEEAT